MTDQCRVSSSSVRDDLAWCLCALLAVREQESWNQVRVAQSGGASHTHLTVLSTVSPDGSLLLLHFTVPMCWNEELLFKKRHFAKCLVASALHNSGGCLYCWSTIWIIKIWQCEMAGNVTILGTNLQIFHFYHCEIAWNVTFLLQNSKTVTIFGN